MAAAALVSLPLWTLWLKPWETQNLGRRGEFLLPTAAGIRGWPALMGHLEVQKEEWRGKVRGRAGWERLHRAGCPHSAHAFYRSCSELAESAQKQQGELSNVELIHEHMGAWWRACEADGP